MVPTYSPLLFHNSIPARPSEAATTAERAKPRIGMSSALTEAPIDPAGPELISFTRNVPPVDPSETHNSPPATPSFAQNSTFPLIGLRIARPEDVGPG